ncbi:PAP2 family protein [Taibaiella soli]|uniref:PAP2 family protein n=2 Tax=Taibaiella soli TaxID=1649169 RepID=A0A2W2B1F2_9BACT|nr:PAP2 family protein [Taibaiella soli]
MELRMLESIQSGRTTTGVQVANGISNTIYPVAAGAVIGELAYGYLAHDKTWQTNGWQMAAGLTVTLGATYILKNTVKRERPFQKYPEQVISDSHTNEYSFPSGHTSTAFSLATSLSLQCPKWYVIAPSFLYAGAIGYSRMYLGMHYPSDVAAGAVIGVASSWITYKGTQWLQHRKQATKKPETF